ncbi:MAG: DUF563 domain-containing protein [Selenomonadaceae bacterium]|nr:DUF563 domain-containing protein [Selenomonadaceae bacterium]
MWFLKSDVFKTEFKNCPIVYVPWATTPLDRQQNFKRLLEILDIDVANLRPITQPTQFDKIILPDGAFFIENYSRKFTQEYVDTIDCVRNFALKNRTAVSVNKLYFAYGVRQVGEERIMEYLKSKGYDIVRPERLTLDEQLNLLINCESFASTIGSCSHNQIFLRDNVEVILIPRAFNRFTGYQLPLDQVHPLNINYVDSSLSIFVNDYADYCYVISEQLKRFFGDKFDGYEDDDFNAFLKYVKKSISNGLNAKPNQITGYGALLQDFMERLKQREDLITACDMPTHWEDFRPLLTYQTHVDKHGWDSDWKSEEQISNPLEQKFDIQAIKINFPNHKVYYSVYFNDAEGWSEEVLAPETAGTVGKRKSIFGLRIRFDEAGSKEFDILYRLHKFDDTWTPWAKNGEALYSYGVKLNAIQIKLENKT